MGFGGVSEVLLFRGESFLGEEVLIGLKEGRGGK